MKKSIIVPAAAFSIFVAFSACTTTTSTVQKLISEGKITEAKECLTTKSDINAVDEEGNSALHIAAKMNESDLVLFLIAKGADMELKNLENETALHVAIANDSIDAARILQGAGSDIFATRADGLTALEAALENDEIYYDIMINEESGKARDINGNTIVHYFVMTCNDTAIRYSIQKNIPLDEKNNAGQTPLFLALENNQSEESAGIAAALLLAGCERTFNDEAYFEEAVLARNLSIKMEDGQTPLHQAAFNNHIGIVKYLLSNGASTTAQDISGATPLHGAVRYGNIDIARLLIENGASVNAKDSLGKTPVLLMIPKDKQQDMYTLLIEKGADVNHKDMFGDSSLHIATMLHTSTEILDMLVNAGANVNMRNKKGITPLETAVEHKYEDHIAFYVQHDADIHATDAENISPLSMVLVQYDNLYKTLLTEKNVNTTDSDGNTPLIKALILDSSFDKIQYIVDLGGKINTRNKSGNSALHVCVEKNMQEEGELLIEKDADIFASNIENISPLYLALTAANGSEDWLINQKTISARDGSGNTALHYAADWKVFAGVKHIIQKGADINAENSNGETPLFNATKADSTSIIELLIAKGSKIDARDHLGSTPLHAAVIWNALTSAELLLDRGIQIDAQNAAGKTALAEAAAEGNSTMALVLLNHKANPNVYDAEGRTCLTDAVKNNNAEMVKILIENNANPQIQDMSGRTAYHDAAAIGNIDVIRLLRRAGANPVARDKKGNSPFSISLEKDQQVMYAVLGNAKNITDSDGNTPVHIAIQHSAVPSVVESLIAKNYPYDTRNSSGFTPLSIAVSENKKDLAVILIEHNATPFAEINARGETVLNVAFTDKTGDLLGYIAKYSADAKDIKGNSVMHYAARYADTITINRLKTFGLNIHSSNISGETPYDVALSWKRNDIADLLK